MQTRREDSGMDLGTSGGGRPDMGQIYADGCRGWISPVGLPDAILFLRILQERVFQPPRLITSAILEQPTVRGRVAMRDFLGAACFW